MVRDHQAHVHTIRLCWTALVVSICVCRLHDDIQDSGVGERLRSYSFLPSCHLGALVGTSCTVEEDYTFLGLL